MLFVPTGIPFMVPEADASHGDSSVTDLTVSHPAGTVIEWNKDYNALCDEHGLCAPVEHGFYQMDIYVNKDNYNGFTEKHGQYAEDGSCVGSCPSEIQFIKVGYVHYTIKLDTTGYPDGDMKLSVRYMYMPNSTYSGGSQFTIGVGADLIDPVITVPQVTLDQWGNKVIELTMSGTTNFPTATWSVSATDNVGVTSGPACWIGANHNSNSGNPVWNSSTQSYDFTVVTNPSGTQFPIGSTGISCAASDAAGNKGWYSFNVKVTHDDPTGFVQMMDKPQSFKLSGDWASKIFNSQNSAQSFNQLKPIADLITQSNSAGMYYRDAEWTLLGGEIEFDDFANSFYTLMKRCTTSSGGGTGCNNYEVPKPLATMLTDSNMAGMWERNLPDRSWTVGNNTITVSENSNSFSTSVQTCYPSGGGTSCQGGSTFKPFADMINESSMNEAMYDRANLRLLDAGGSAAPAPESSASDTSLTISVPPDFTAYATNSTGQSYMLYWASMANNPLYSGIVEFTKCDGSNVGISGDLDKGDWEFHNRIAVCDSSGNILIKDPVGGSIASLGCSPAYDTLLPIGINTITCTATDNDGNTGTASFTVTVILQEPADTTDTTPPVIAVPADITITTSNSSGWMYECDPTCPTNELFTNGYCYGFQGCTNTAFPAGIIATDPPDPVTGQYSGVISGASCDPARDANDSELELPVLYPIGTTTVTCTATDAAGNVGTASFTVTVVLEGSGAIQPPADNLNSYTEPHSGFIFKYPDSIDGVEIISFTTYDDSWCTGITAGVPNDSCIRYEYTIKNTLNVPIIKVKMSHHIFENNQLSTSSILGTNPSNGCEVGSSWYNEVTSNSSYPCYGYEQIDPGETAILWYRAEWKPLESSQSYPISWPCQTTTSCEAHAYISALELAGTTSDTTPPLIIVKMQPNPSNWTNSTSNPSGMIITLDAEVYDADTGDWFGAATCSPSSGSNFPVGTTTVTCTGTDATGNVGTESWTVTVVLEGAAADAAAAAAAAAIAALEAEQAAAAAAAAEAEASLGASDAAWVEANPGMVKNAVGSSTPGCEDTNSCFIPSTIAISTGDTVTWVNSDNAAHTVTSGTTLGGSSGVFDSTLMMAGGTSFSHTFDTAGTYPYLCMVHPWMLGTVIVTGAAVEEEIVIPSWIKSNAGWWDAGLIDDRNYVTGLQWLITNGIMTIPTTEQGTGSDDVIPSWVKNNARWWADGSIDDRNYVTGLQWLITNGVMTIG